MSFAGYLAGLTGLAVVVASMVVASVHARRFLLPGWTHAPARLAEVVLAISVLMVVLLLLGAVGLLHPVAVIVAMAAVGAAARRLPPASAEQAKGPPDPEVSPFLVWLGFAAAALVAVRWATGIDYSWSNGMNHFDTLWYHGPFAAGFAQTGSTWGLHFTDTQYLNWFYPQNSELLHSVGYSLFGRDLLSPLLNLGWLGLALLAAWCIGRPFGAGPISMTATAAILATGMMVPREPGNAANDIGSTALVLTSAALLINASSTGRLTRGALIVGGLASGLAVGTKLTTAATVVALAVAAGVLSRPGERARSVAIWVAAVFATGGYWFVRNVAHAGNPVPWLSHIGPVSLPAPARGLEGRDPFSVFHYIANPSHHVFVDVMGPALHEQIGLAWPAVLVAAVVGMVLAVARGHAPEVRVLGAVAIVAGLAYLVTPLTASGREGTAGGFEANIRYAIPALALGLSILPLDRGLATPTRRLWVGAIAFWLLITVVFTASDSGIGPEVSYLRATLIGILVSAIAIGFLILVESRPRAALGLAAATAVVLASVVWLVQDDYFHNRYRAGVGYGLGPAVHWADQQSDKRIAVAGSGGAFFQYGFYGQDLSNRVEYVGRPTAHGGYETFESCDDWRRAVNAGDYDYLVTTGNLDLNSPFRLTPSNESLWAIAAPSAALVLQEGLVAVYELRGDLDPAACPVV